VFKEIRLTAMLDEFGEIKTELIKKNENEFKIAENEYVKGSIIIKNYDKSCVINACIDIVPYPPYDYNRCFDAYKGLTLELVFENEEIQGLSLERFNPFWTSPKFFDDFTQLADNTQQVLIKAENEYIHVMPISGASAMCCARASEDKNTLIITAGKYFGGSEKIEAPICVISVSDNPYKAVEESYNTVCENGVIITPKKEKKSYPKQLNGLGWCTWNAFYHDVTAQGIEEKLKEFKEKNIPIKWIMIDDGWAKTKDFKLISGYVDEEKFPNGLKAFIEYIKKEYGIKYVGIWHAFTGYWFGIDKNGEEYGKNVFSENNSGLVLPSGDEDNAYAFYSEWHKYLKEQGVDFLKVDTQGNGFEFYKNTKDVCQKVVNLHNALEQSVAENFDSVMINCMGMGSMDMFARKSSNMVRNSDDFFPNKEDGFESHITQNAYNAIFNDNLFYCDYDMWWTKHISAKQSSVLRAISGGPVYVSDEIGNTDSEYLMPIIDENGDVLRCDNAAKPTNDCVFKNPHNGVLKIFNTVGDDIVIAVFNLSNKKQSASINLNDVYATGEYNMHQYFAKECGRFSDGMTLQIEPNDVEIINLSRGEIADTSKYISVACNK